MRQTLSVSTWAATIVLAFSLSALPAFAQSLGASREYCQNANGHLVCKQVTGSTGTAANRPYEQWDDGSPARGSGSSSEYQYRSLDSHQFPQYFRGYNALYGFGR